MRHLLIILAVAIATQYATGQNQADLRDLWKMQRLANQKAGNIYFDTFDESSTGDMIIRFIVGPDTVYGRTLLEAFIALHARTQVSVWDAYVAECSRDTVRHTWITGGELDSVRINEGVEYFYPLKDVGYYAPRNPPTLPGFMEYLKRKQ